MAVTVAHGYLQASGVAVKLDQERVSTVARELKRPGATAADTAEALTTWGA